MKEVIEIYIKIIIAVFGFVAPSFTLLISIYIEGIEKKRIKQEEEIKQLERLIKNNLANNSADLEGEMKSNLKQLEVKKRESTHELNLLNPKRQVIRMFLPLLFSLICIILYYVERSNIYTYLNVFSIKCITISISVMFFSYALFVLWQLFDLIIETKKSLISDRESIILQPEDIKL